VDPRDPQYTYKSPIARFSSMIPLERDAVLKRGPPYHRYEILSEPHYSRPLAGNSKLVAYSAGIYEFTINSCDGKKGTGKGITLKPVKGMNISLEHSRSSIRVFCADASGVAEIPMDGKTLVRIPASEAARMLERSHLAGLNVAVYIVAGGTGDKPVRYATTQDTKKYAQDQDAFFLLAPSDFPVYEIEAVSLDF